MARYVRKGARFRLRNLLRSGNRGPAGSERIAGNDEIVGNGAALDVRLRSPGSVRKDLALLVSVFRGIGINKDSGSAFVLRGESFEAPVAIGIGIADENDLALHVDAVLAQDFVVLGITTVRIDDGRSNVGVSGHAQPAGSDVRILGVGIDVVGGLAHTSFVRDR